MKRFTVGLILILCLSSLALSACGGSGGEKLMNERCSTCHTVDVIKNSAKTRAEWQTTVTRMVNRGAALSSSEETTLLDYLASTFGK
jgi:cytochrome c5